MRKNLWENPDASSKREEGSMESQSGHSSKRRRAVRYERDKPAAVTSFDDDPLLNFLVGPPGDVEAEP